MNALLAFLAFAALIVLHEFGHFAAAKAVGMRVERFALFFPPLIWRKRRDGAETEYAIGAIPLGGYVKITGMNPEEELPEELRARSYSGSPVWKRVVVIAAGPLVNLLIAFILLTGIFVAEGRFVPAVGVATVTAGSPADGKLEPGDLIVSVDGVPGYARGQSQSEIDARIAKLREHIAAAGCESTGCTDGKPVQVTVLRDGKTLTTQITPQYDAELKRPLVGIAFGGNESLNLAQASQASVEGMWRVTRLTVEAIVKVVYDPNARKEVSSVVGGYEATRQSLAVDTVQALQLIALISLSLAVINLFPFLPLDGGHIFWAIVEKLRGGKRVSTATMEKASFVGFALVIMLFVIGVSNDIGRITSGEGFGVR